MGSSKPPKVRERKGEERVRESGESVGERVGETVGEVKGVEWEMVERERKSG